MFGWVLNMPQFIIGSSGTVAKFRTLINSLFYNISEKSYEGKLWTQLFLL